MSKRQRHRAYRAALRTRRERKAKPAWPPGPQLFPWQRAMLDAILRQPFPPAPALFKRRFTNIGKSRIPIKAIISGSPEKFSADVKRDRETVTIRYADLTRVTVLDDLTDKT